MTGKSYRHTKKLNSHLDISHAEISKTVSFDPETGEFIFTYRMKGKKTDRGYLYISYGGLQILAHRLAWFLLYGRWPTHTIDHINGDRADNRLSNLREADWSQNLFNTKKQSHSNPSGVKGVFYENNKWVARIGYRKKSYWLGAFTYKEDAISARKSAEKRLHGEYARKE